MKATFFIHIGLHKTGTTSIQATLFKNRVRLRRCDINYLSINQNHSESLYPLFCANPHLYHMNRAIGVDTEEKAAERNAIIDKALGDELEGNTCSRFVISGEDLIRLTRTEIERFRQRLEPFATGFCIVVYVRDPYAFVNSAFQQRLRAGATYAQLLANPPRPGYRRIRKFIEAFGRQNVDIRIFEQARFVDGDLIADFLTAVGAKGGLAKDIDVIRANEALSLEAALILNEVNKLHPRGADETPNPSRAADLPRRLAAVPGQRFRCPSAVIAAVEPLMADDLQWLHGVLGESVFTAKPQWEEPSPNWSGDTLNSLAAVINDMANTIAKERKSKDAIAPQKAGGGAMPAIAAILRRWIKATR